MTMIHFESDYTEGAHPAILDRLVQTNLTQTEGYGVDEHCENAARLIREACGAPQADVHFTVGGTQTNKLVIAAALRPHQGVIAAETGHISIHESGAIESTGHKVIALPTGDGKLSAVQVEAVCKGHAEDEAREHIVQPAMLYISTPTEAGTLYSLQELRALSEVCRRNGLIFFIDGARMGYGLVAEGNDVQLSDLAELCDVFYIGGTKVGALFGEAIVLCNKALNKDFRYILKQHGAMLAKGRLLGIQFETLFSNDLYTDIARNALRQADRIREAVRDGGWEFKYETVTNQIFVIMPDDKLAELEKQFIVSHIARHDSRHTVIRLCTSWATTDNNTALLCHALRSL